MANFLPLRIKNKKTGLRISDNSNICGMHSNKKFQNVYFLLPTRNVGIPSFFYWDETDQKFCLSPV